MIRRRTLFAALVLAACAPKSEASPEGAAGDSTAVDSSAMVATDSGAAMPMGQPGASVIDSASAMKKGTKVTSKQPAGMGRDSAYGPTFVVDSTGKMVPIVKKKP